MVVSRLALAAVMSASVTLACSRSAAAESQRPGPPDVMTLPYPDAPFRGVIGRTTRDSKADFPQPVRAPKGAPNVLLIPTDDVGFGASNTFGGPVPTPTLDAVAAQ